jgi:hypothetical protein
VLAAIDDLHDDDLGWSVHSGKPSSASAGLCVDPRTKKTASGAVDSL